MIGPHRLSRLFVTLVLVAVLLLAGLVGTAAWRRARLPLVVIPVTVSAMHSYNEFSLFDDGRMLAIQGSREFSPSGPIQIWSLEPPTLLRTLDDGTQGRLFAAAPRSDLVLTVENERMVLRAARSWQLVANVVPAHPGARAHGAEAAFAMDGQTFALIIDHSVELHRTRDGALLASVAVDAHIDLHFSPDGTFVLGHVIETGVKRSAFLWRLPEKAAQMLAGGDPVGVTSRDEVVEEIDDGMTQTSSGWVEHSRVVVARLDDRKVIRDLGRDLNMDDFRVSASGEVYATRGSDWTEVRSIVTGKRKRRIALPRREQGLPPIALSASGDRLAVVNLVDHNFQVQVWEIPP
jgi:hypothetical protein